jgi:hypothetical protein
MNARINYEKSIQNERLIYSGTRRQKLAVFFKTYVLGILGLILSLALFIYALFYSSRLVIILAFLPVLPIIISMILLNKLVKIEGTEMRKNHHEIIRILLGKFPGILRHNCSEKIIIITSAPKFLSLNKEILVLLKNTHVYLNISLTVLGKIKYVFLSIPNYFKSKYILKNFCRKIEEHHLQRSQQPV